VLVIAGSDDTVYAQDMADAVTEQLGVDCTGIATCGRRGSPLQVEIGGGLQRLPKPFRSRRMYGSGRYVQFRLNCGIVGHLGRKVSLLVFVGVLTPDEGAVPRPYNLRIYPFLQRR